MDFHSEASARPFTHGQISWMSLLLERYSETNNFERDGF